MIQANLLYLFRRKSKYLDEIENQQLGFKKIEVNCTLPRNQKNLEKFNNKIQNNHVIKTHYFFNLLLDLTKIGFKRF